MKKIEKICINCPAGCHLEIAVDDNKISVSGNRCPKGKSYGESEITDPRRTVTAAVLVKSDKRCCIPVKSSPIAGQSSGDSLDGKGVFWYNGSRREGYT